MLALFSLSAGCAEPPVPEPRADPVAVRIGTSEVLGAVVRAGLLTRVPATLGPRLATAGRDIGFDNSRCEAAPAADHLARPCVFGDPAAGYRVVLYGDSHAGMWLPALIAIAARRHWRVELLGKPGCPPAVPTVCDRFRSFVERRMPTARPSLILVTGQSYGHVAPSAWYAGLAGTLRRLRRSGTRVVVVGETPVLADDAAGCLAAHDVRACSTTRAAATARLRTAADERAAAAAGAGYVDVTPWLCGRICTPVIGDVLVYRNRFHLTATYARRVSGALEDALLANGAL